MEWMIIVFGALAIVGIVLAVVEWRKGKTLLAHDLNLRSGSESEADRELHRIKDEIQTRASHAVDRYDV